MRSTASGAGSSGKASQCSTPAFSASASRIVLCLLLYSKEQIPFPLSGMASPTPFSSTV